MIVGLLMLIQEQWTRDYLATAIDTEDDQWNADARDADTVVCMQW